MRKMTRCKENGLNETASCLKVRIADRSEALSSTQLGLQGGTLKRAPIEMSKQVANLCVHGTRCSGNGSRDSTNYFGEKKSGSFAVGRLFQKLLHEDSNVCE